MSALRFEHVSYSYPGAGTDALREVSLSVERRASSAWLPACRARASRRCCAPPPAWCRTSTAARSPATVTVGGLDTREHGPAELGAIAGTLFQDPETQVVMSTVRAELALALENRGRAAAAVARAVEEAALALGIAHLLDRPTGRALRRRAAARGAWRGARRRGRGWCCSTSRPPSWIPSPATS